MTKPNRGQRGQRNDTVNPTHFQYLPENVLTGTVENLMRKHCSPHGKRSMTNPKDYRSVTPEMALDCLNNFEFRDQGNDTRFGDTTVNHYMANGDGTWTVVNWLVSGPFAGSVGTTMTADPKRGDMKAKKAEKAVTRLFAYDDWQHSQT
jgi:hypothetical protein